MKHFVAFFDFASDFWERRNDFRDQHLRRAWAASDRGELILAGALGGSSGTGLFLLKFLSAEEAEDFVRSDPYVTNGLITGWRLEEWVTTVGEDAATPVWPAQN